MTPRETTVAASVVADMLQYLAGRGVPTSYAINRTQIDTSFASSPDTRVRGSRVERLWQLAVEHTGDAVVGLHMGETYNPGALDILGYVVLSCRTIGDLLERLARYARLLNDGLRVELVRQGATVFCRLTFVEGMDNYLLRSPTHAVDATWAGLARELGRLGSRPVRPLEVWFRHAAPPNDLVAEYRRVIGAPLRFDAQEDRFTLAYADLAEPLRSANPALLQVFEKYAEAALNTLEREDSRASQVARVMAEKLKGSSPPLGEVARHLAMSSRNLQRVLRESGTSYQALLDEVRRDLAIQHLANPATSIGQVGFLLGFSEPSAFHRAFRRWTGKPPGAFRAPTSARRALSP